MVAVTQFFSLCSLNQGSIFPLSSGGALNNAVLAYQTYGRLTAERDNAVLIFHALSGSQHVAGFNQSLSATNPLWTEECHVGWWNNFVGPERAIDTNKFFVICANFIGGCYGSTGPSSINPETGKPYGSTFPKISVSDIVDSQMRLVEFLGIKKLRAVIGPSLGGMLALNLSLRYPESAGTVVIIGCGLRISTLQRISRFEQICAIESDPNFNGGDYYEGPRPQKGLALARMIAHKSYVSLKVIERRARQEICTSSSLLSKYEIKHPLESYMAHQGEKFIKRFDANTYLLIAEAWQRYDLLRDVGGIGVGDCHEEDPQALSKLLSRASQQRFLVFSIDSDVCFYPEEQREMVLALKEAGVKCNYITVHSDKGHDAFLVEPDLFAPYLGFELNRQL